VAEEIPAELFFLHYIFPNFIEEEAESYGKSDGVEIAFYFRRRVQRGEIP
jgi:hypothetical protein